MDFIRDGTSPSMVRGLGCPPLCCSEMRGLPWAWVLRVLRQVRRGMYSVLPSIRGALAAHSSVCPVELWPELEEECAAGIDLGPWPEGPPDWGSPSGPPP